jgi:WD40 repeat protein
VVRVIDLEKKLVQKSFIASKETIKEMILHDNYVYISGCDPVIRAYNFETGRPRLFTGHSGWVYCLFIHDNFLFSGGDDKVVRIWDIKSVTCVEELRAHRNGVTSVCVCGGKLYTGSFDHYIVEYDYAALLERISEK